MLKRLPWGSKMTAAANTPASSAMRMPKRLRSAKAATVEIPARIRAHQSACGNKRAT